MNISFSQFQKKVSVRSITCENLCRTSEMVIFLLGWYMVEGWRNCRLSFKGTLIPLSVLHFLIQAIGGLEFKAWIRSLGTLKILNTTIVETTTERRFLRPCQYKWELCLKTVNQRVTKQISVGYVHKPMKLIRIITLITWVSTKLILLQRN